MNSIGFLDRYERLTARALAANPEARSYVEGLSADWMTVLRRIDVPDPLPAHTAAALGFLGREIEVCNEWTLLDWLDAYPSAVANAFGVIP